MDTEDGVLNDLATFQEASRKFTNMKDSMKVKYSMLVETYTPCNTTLSLDEVGSSLLPSDLTDEGFNAYWLVYILFTNHFEMISTAIVPLDAFSKKFVNDIVVNLRCCLWQLVFWLFYSIEFTKDIQTTLT